MICISHFKKKHFEKKLGGTNSSPIKILCINHNSLHSLFLILISGKMQTGGSNFHFKDYKLKIKRNKNSCQLLATLQKENHYGLEWVAFYCKIFHLHCQFPTSKCS